MRPWEVNRRLLGGRRSGSQLQQRVKRLGEVEARNRDRHDAVEALEGGQSGNRGGLLVVRVSTRL